MYPEVILSKIIELHFFTGEHKSWYISGYKQIKNHPLIALNALNYTTHNRVGFFPSMPLRVKK